jgi:hypothetical protein
MMFIVSVVKQLVGFVFSMFPLYPPIVEPFASSDLSPVSKLHYLTVQGLKLAISTQSLSNVLDSPVHSFFLCTQRMFYSVEDVTL